MNPSKVITAMCLALLTGCAVGPDYKRPTVNTSSSWASALADGETNSPARLAAWWETFRDPELNSLIARAVQSNLVLRVAEAHVREARAQRGVVAAGLGPDLAAAGGYSRNRYSQNGFPPLPPTVPLDYNLYQAGFDAVWELDVFGGTRRAVEAANADIEAAQFGRDDVLRSLLSEVARDYIEARSFQQRLIITRENIQAQQGIVKLTTDLFHSGLTSELDVQQAQALLAATESQVPVFETGFRNSTYRLDVLLGQRSGTLLGELSKETPIPTTPPQVPVGLPSDLLLRRPDVRRAEQQLAAATAKIGQAKADFFPKFSLTGDVGLTSISASDWWSAGSRFWSAGPSVVWPVFESGRILANVHVQDARESEALDTYQQTVLVAFQEVDSALTAYANEQVRRQALSQSAQADQKALNLADDLYRQGLTDFIRVLVSERALYLAQDALVQSDQQVASDLVALYKALGGGWETVELENSNEVSSASN